MDLFLKKVFEVAKLLAFYDNTKEPSNITTLDVKGAQRT